LRIYLSKRPKRIGGGSNTFSWLFKKWAKRNGYKIVRKMDKADVAIIIAHFGDEDEINKAKSNGCYVIHRLDEYFEKNEDETRRRKHEKIVRLNALTDLTIFQSWFVFDNVYPYIKPKNYRIVHNGSDPELFYPARDMGQFIGHVTWGVDQRKRLEILNEFIKEHPQESFLLIGRQKESPFSFAFPNVRVIGKVSRKKMPKYYRMMKLLYFPSEKDPCPNTVIEAILSGVPVCHNPIGGTVELVNGWTENSSSMREREEGREKRNEEKHKMVCGLPLDDADEMLRNLEPFRANCLSRKDLHFSRVFEQYMALPIGR
jgi:glycosyltransferase involved in cell wall biosynthesis